ncbi:MAG: hypothetical protein AB1390_07085 [Nitrospirota bacterium]
MNNRTTNEWIPGITRQGPATPSGLRLGEILIATDQITPDQLRETLEAQRVSGKRIGDILVESGCLEPQQVSCALTLQKSLMTAVLLALLSVAPAADAVSNGCLQQGADPTGLALNNKPQTLTFLRVIYQTSEIVITQADITRGYVDVPVAAKMEIQNNNLSGYLIVFGGLNGPFKEAAVEGLGKEIRITSAGGWIAEPYNGRDPFIIELSYKFILSENAYPGTYAWPLTISVSPIIPV